MSKLNKLKGTELVAYHEFMEALGRLCREGHLSAHCYIVYVP